MNNSITLAMQGRVRQGSNTTPSPPDYSAIIVIINSMSGGSDIAYEAATSTLVQQYGASGTGDIETMIWEWSNIISLNEPNIDNALLSEDGLYALMSEDGTYLLIPEDI